MKGPLFWNELSVCFLGSVVFWDLECDLVYGLDGGGLCFEVGGERTTKDSLCLLALP